MRTLVISLVCAGVLMVAPVVQAGGLYISEFMTPTMGTASAGANAVASDASTVLHNAAGMTRLDSH